MKNSRYLKKKFYPTAVQKFKIKKKKILKFLLRFERALIVGAPATVATFSAFSFAGHGTSFPGRLNIAGLRTVLRVEEVPSLRHRVDSPVGGEFWKEP